MRVLITGVNGFIGAATADLFLKNGITVVGIDNFSNSNKRALNLDIDFLEADVADPDLFEKIGKVDACVHLAGYIDSGESMHSPEKYFENNVCNTILFLNNMIHKGIHKVIFSSSAAVYRSSTNSISELSPLGPSSVYGQTKLIIDNVLDTFASLEKLYSISLRYFNAAGSHEQKKESHNKESHIIPLAVDAAFSTSKSFDIYGNDYATPDGTCVRDYVHVSDLARAHFLSLIQLETTKRSIYNLGSGKGVSNLQIISLIEKLSGETIDMQIRPRRSGDSDVLVADISKAKNVLQWEPEKTIVDCIQDCISSRVV